ncbi:MAG: hypothetical protein IBX45_06130 [Campylobacterales bacterium]|nr:hypothetical protein [Campylobacterales bacterium]
MDLVLGIAKFFLLGMLVFAGGIVVTKHLARFVSSASKKDDDDTSTSA